MDTLNCQYCAAARCGRPHPGATRRLGLVLTLLIVCLAMAAMGSLANAADEPAAPVTRPASRLGDQNERIQRLQESIIEQKLKVLDTKKKERGVLTELESLNQRLLDQRSTLTNLNKGYQDQENLLNEKQRALIRTTAEKEFLKPHVEKRLAAFYRSGTVTLLNVLFSANTLPDLLSYQENFLNLLQYDRKAIAGYIDTINGLEQAKKEHGREKARLLELMSEVTQQERQLASTHKEKQNLLKRISTEKNLYQQAAAEIEEAANDLTESLKNLKHKKAEPTDAADSPAPATAAAPLPTDQKQKAVPAAAGQKTSPSFAAQKGRLEPPVTGSVITSFGQNTGKFGIDAIARGIDIKTPAGTQIRAVYDGRVINAGTMQGYGNILIIDHGQQYYTIISRAAEFYKKEGEKVAKGEVVGISGPDDAILGAGIHFEIRRGPTPENPLDWLDKSKLGAMTIEPAEKLKQRRGN